MTKSEQAFEVRLDEVLADIKDTDVEEVANWRLTEDQRAIGTPFVG